MLAYKLEYKENVYRVVHVTLLPARYNSKLNSSNTIFITGNRPFKLNCYNVIHLSILKDCN